MRIDNYTKNSEHHKSRYTKSTNSTRASHGFNLLEIKTLRSVVLWSWFPYVFQAIMLLAFIALIIIGWQIYTPDNINDKLFAKTNIVTLVIWGIWWPLMVWLAVTMGRVWCMVCPLELVLTVTERLSRKLGVKQKALPKWIRGGAIIVFIYALIQLLVAGIHLHRIPAYTSFFLIGLLTLSAFVGIFFKDRAFCRGFCPIGMLLNAYGRGGMIAVRAGSGDTCQNCAGKDCVTACIKNKFDGRSCPSLLNPPKLNSNKDCLVCGQCIKSCRPDNRRPVGGMQLLLRKPFDKNDAREEKASWALTIFIMLVSGFVTSELSTEWETANNIFVMIPEYISSLTGLHSLSGFIEGIWTIAIFPILMWTIFGLVTMLTNGANSITDAWRRLALPLVIIISAGHLTKAVAKLNTWIGFLPGSLKDNNGENTAKLLDSGINISSTVMSEPAISIIGALLLIIAFGYSIREEKIIYNKHFYSHFLPKLILFSLFLIIVIGIGI